MVITTEISPASTLAPFVRCYSYREFNTNGEDLIKPWHATNELHMAFFFKAKPVQLINNMTGAVIKGDYSGIVGLSSQFNGDMTFNGCYSFFSIHFKPNGFYKIFRIPTNEVTNQIICGDDLFGSASKNLFEQLGNSSDMNEMVTTTNAFLLYYINKQKSVEFKDGITCISNTIIKNPITNNIDQFANEVNMSTRNFERRFREQVGISPKLYCRINRFNHALNFKINHLQKDWAFIALDFGYFDQMHLIKDFKEFAGNSPLKFFKYTPLPEESYLSRVKP